MALIIKLDSPHGITAPLYWRLNNFDQLGNRQPDGSHIPAVARFRSYLNEDAFRAGKAFLDELQVDFIPSSVSADLAAEAYAALKALDPSLPAAEAVVQAATDLDDAKAREAEAMAEVKALPKDKDGEVVERVKAEAEFASQRVADLTAHLDQRKAEHKRQAKVRKAIETAKDA